MKKLIINADDLGADEGRNQGIFEAIHAGRVTSASILPNGPGILDALERIRSESYRNISWGIHINLSEGKPVSTGKASLLAPYGTFLGKISSQRLLMREKNGDLENEITREINAQITLLKTSGIPLVHLDGHQHIHVFPAVLRAVIGAAQRHHIPWIRIPDEPEPTSPDITLPFSLIEEARLFSRLGRRARAIILESGLQIADHFRGLYLKGHLSIQGLESILKQLPDGLTELMVHPGRYIENPSDTPFSSFSTRDREQELETLLMDKLRLIIEESGMILTPFPETIYS